MYVQAFTFLLLEVIGTDRRRRRTNGEPIIIDFGKHEAGHMTGGVAP